MEWIKRSADGKFSTLLQWHRRCSVSGSGRPGGEQRSMIYHLRSLALAIWLLIEDHSAGENEPYQSFYYLSPKLFFFRTVLLCVLVLQGRPSVAKLAAVRTAGPQRPDDGRHSCCPALSARNSVLASASTAQRNDSGKPTPGAFFRLHKPLVLAISRRDSQPQLIACHSPGVRDDWPG